MLPGGKKMTRNTMDLKTLLDIPEWEKVQDQFAKLTGTAIITIDYKGMPISKHSERTDFCTVIRENPVSRKRCYKCDALAGLEAVRTGKPYIYLCHCGIVDVAVPVVVGDTYLGAVMFGQVRIPNNDTDTKVERLVSEISSFHAEDETAREDLLEMFNRLPEMEYKRVEEIADMLNAVVQYIVNRSLKMKSDSMQYDYLQNKMPPSFDGGGREADEMLNVLGKMEEPPKRTIYDTPINEEKTYDVPISSPVYPAVYYIDKHMDELPAMKDMAKLCHLSASYFSKVFLREAHENYTDYLHRKKVNVAKELMRNSNDSIGQIALSLGYQDTSYFVKVFKKFEGVTPSVHKRWSKKDN